MANPARPARPPRCLLATSARLGENNLQVTGTLVSESMAIVAWRQSSTTRPKSGGFSYPLSSVAALAGGAANAGGRILNRPREIGMTRMSWTDERVELLKKLWSDGLSASQIATQLGGVTRNAVIGKVHRLSLSGRAKPVSSTPRQRKVRTAAPHRPSGRAYIAGNTALKLHTHADSAACAGIGADRRPGRADQPERVAARAERPDVQMADRRPGRRRLPLLRPPQLQQPALLRIPLPASPISRSTTADATGSAATTDEGKRSFAVLCGGEIVLLEPFPDRSQRLHRRR